MLLSNCLRAAFVRFSSSEVAMAREGEGACGSDDGGWGRGGGGAATAARVGNSGVGWGWSSVTGSKLRGSWSLLSVRPSKTRDRWKMSKASLGDQQRDQQRSWSGSNQHSSPIFWTSGDAGSAVPRCALHRPHEQSSRATAARSLCSTRARLAAASHLHLSAPVTISTAAGGLSRSASSHQHD